ncbi:hypothetical protein L227DRAFT_617565 [Lentinus tigrinus ALCF2SS1-6]|uniref:Uncharacterized protein n=1 Tax=Lentinus tigrinus ALCF2SS1-6 TaxID=1328759 RepID=A0A5C2RNL1_9APHY|nr:hypothetical protein L227DRAFT_617565 [Lentinus tigrinus ALCF2SS1-6]
MSAHLYSPSLTSDALSLCFISSTSTEARCVCLQVQNNIFSLCFISSTSTEARCVCLQIAAIDKLLSYTYQPDVHEWSQLLHLDYYSTN